MSPPNAPIEGTIWIDGEMHSVDTAHVSASDHGVTVGDGVFETLKIVDGQAFALTRHLRRLRRSAEGLGLPPQRCVVFEDSVVGVHAARNAGMRVIGLATAHTVRELLTAGAERAIPDFEGFTWPV